ncbi:hypothetical protein PG985_011885 [Apiospora marii]|uniref:uncharacterized protein n=1 Tax=Apiospora marii TaxID=335849 RepID=UPI00312D6EAC
MGTDEPVYLGVWTNWSKGSVILGATLTMTREYGNFLIAFTALFVPFVASRFWRIFAIWFHQCYSSSDQRDTLYHQRQVVLRNATSPESGLISFIRLIWAWRRVARRPLLRVLPVAIFAFCSIAVFTVAGVFTSEISKADEVLVNGDHCEAGSNLVFDWEDIETASDAYVYWGTFVEKVASYARQCYTNDSSGLLECSRLVTGSIPTASQDNNAPCPFDPSCAPLTTAGRSHNITISGQNFTVYDYGPSLSSHSVELNASDINVIANYTYIVSDIETQYPEAGFAYTDNNNFLLSSRPVITYEGNVSNGSAYFYPDPAIVRHDGDVTLIFLSGNGVNFESLGEDDWYRATARLHNSTFDSEARLEYRPDEAASPLGCIEQFQLCRDPALGQCGNLASGYDSVSSAAPWFNMTAEEVRGSARPTSPTKSGSLLSWIYLMLFNEAITVPSIIEQLGPASLASKDFVSQGYIDGIGKNQWQLDATRWFQIMLAGFQTLFIDTAEGITASSSGPVTFKPLNDYDWNICRNQKIRSTQYTSFSMLGLIVTYSLGALIILLSFIIEPMLRILHSRGRYNKYTYLEWEANTSIQLHRVAQDQLGHGNWSHCDERVPITRPGDLLGALDITDPAHPMLAHPVEENSEDTELKNTGQAWSERHAFQMSPVDDDRESLSGCTYKGVHRALSDTYAQPLKSNCLQDSDEKSQKVPNRPRPSTAP